MDPLRSREIVRPSPWPTVRRCDKSRNNVDLAVKVQPTVKIHSSLRDSSNIPRRLNT